MTVREYNEVLLLIKRVIREAEQDGLSPACSMEITDRAIVSLGRIDANV
jgi:hypothetical protein